MRGATDKLIILLFFLSHFNPRAPCGARLCSEAVTTHSKVISTHAPLAGRDSFSSTLRKCISEFQPTRPLRGATQHFQTNYFGNLFQPTRPLRGATSITIAKTPTNLFQPTRPLRGATNRVFNPSNSSNISTHAPLAGRDRQKTEKHSRDFISTHAPLAGRDRQER